MELNSDSKHQKRTKNKIILDKILSQCEDLQPAAVFPELFDSSTLQQLEKKGILNASTNVFIVNLEPIKRESVAEELKLPGTKCLLI